MISRTPKGLYCSLGDFYIDPNAAVRRAIITHCHTDHLRAGSESYLMSPMSESIARQRIAQSAKIETLNFGEEMQIGEVTVSLHPAGHILGSAQVRIEHEGEVWVVSGDYKLEPDATCETFESIKCDTFITESTFAHPRYKWKKQSEIFARINDWWQLNAAWGRTSVLFGYSLGKAQRLLAGVDASIGPILVYHTVEKFNPSYKRANIPLPDYHIIDEITLASYKGKGALIIAPPEIRKTNLLSLVGEYETAFASGWMSTGASRRSAMYDAGFALSDHADWEGLLEAVEATGARRVFVMHGFVENLVDHLRAKGLDARGW